MCLCLIGKWSRVGETDATLFLQRIPNLPFTFFSRKEKELGLYFAKYLYTRIENSVRRDASR
jgi:hypothetical protein